MRVRATVRNSEVGGETVQQRFLVEMGYSRSPAEIISLIRNHKQVTLEFLNGQDTCNTLNFGKLLGEGKSGSVFAIEDDDNKGLPVVLKEFTAKESPKRDKNSKSNDIYVLSSSLCDIVMSSIFHSFFEGKSDYCISFPYFEGFFVCDGLGYAISEQLDTTLARWIGGDNFNAEIFRSLVFQCFYVLLFLNKKEIVHNDMHAKNVMIRSTKGISYRGTKIDNFKYLGFAIGGKNYYLPNLGTIGKLIDFDFSTKYSSPAIVPNKVYVKEVDEWNLQFRFATTYDALTFAAYMVYYVGIRRPGSEGSNRVSKDEIKEARSIVAEIADFFVGRAEKETGDIKDRGHYAKEADGRVRDRDSVTKLMDMVAVPCYRPYEKYCHLNLGGILDLKCFRNYRESKNGALMVAALNNS